ncbi:MAG: hypothetical protein WKF40_00150 [Thermoleophilaceae bacterium]
MLAEVLDLALRALALGDIADQRHEQASVARVDDTHPHLRREGLALPAPSDDLERPRPAAAELIVDLGESARRRTVQQVGDRATEQLAPGVAVGLAGAGVGVEHAAALVVEQVGVQRVLDQAPKTVLALGQRLLEVTAPGGARSSAQRLPCGAF